MFLFWYKAEVFIQCCYCSKKPRDTESSESSPFINGVWTNRKVETRHNFTRVFLTLTFMTLSTSELFVNRWLLLMLYLHQSWLVQQPQTTCRVPTLKHSRRGCDRLLCSSNCYRRFGTTMFPKSTPIWQKRPFTIIISCYKSIHFVAKEYLKSLDKWSSHSIWDGLVNEKIDVASETLF